MDLNEEYKLITDYLEDKSKSDALIKYFQPNIDSIVNIIIQKYGSKKDFFDAEYQAVSIVLEKAKTFDPSHGVRFNTYFEKAVIGGVIKLLIESTPYLKPPESIRDDVRKLKDFRDNFLQEHNKEPNDNDYLNGIVDLDKEDIMYALIWMKKSIVYGLDENRGNFDNDDNDDFDDSSSIDDKLIEFVQSFKDTKERQIGQMILQGRRNKEIREKENCSQYQIRIIKKRITKKEEYLNKIEEVDISEELNDALLGKRRSFR